NEYRDIEDFVKGRLEEGVSSSPPRLAEIERAAAAESFAHVAEHRSRRRCTVAMLVAASIAIVFSLAILHIDSSPKPENTVACVIDLLRTADGAETLSATATDSESEETAVAEMLLAWQDAPYESAIADL
ncbi:MAG: hypothetical protein IKO55_03620, partial [Kiritimatiellae bacterium]|nr:hypothetical protein [Kiritimatiellia bacterium]